MKTAQSKEAIRESELRAFWCILADVIDIRQGKLRKASGTFEIGKRPVKGIKSRKEIDPKCFGGGKPEGFIKPRRRNGLRI